MHYKLTSTIGQGSEFYACIPYTQDLGNFDIIERTVAVIHLRKAGTLAALAHAAPR
jgi:hypothetical protein